MDIHCEFVWCKLRADLAESFKRLTQLQAIVGFAVLKFFQKTFSENFPILGGKFGPKENNIVQTSAMAAGGMSNVFASAIPAMYQLNLLNNPQSDYKRLITFTLVGGFWGLFFATPCELTIGVELFKQYLTKFDIQYASSSLYTSPESSD